MDLTIEKGRGYVPAEENKKLSSELGVISMDSIFTPVKNVKYTIEDYRVEQKTDYEKLIFEIVTDGSIHPKDALTEAAKTLIHHFLLFSDERITLESDEIAQTETYDEESLHMRQLLKTKLIDMDLSVRALNCLKAAEVDTLGDLVSFNKNDLMKFRNFGKKSLTELEELVVLKGLSFGMDLSKYKLEKRLIVLKHGKKKIHLGRKSAHRKSLLANLACSLIEHKRINTTLTKAKALKRFVEPIITKSKEDTTHKRRLTYKLLRNKYAVSDLFRYISLKLLTDLEVILVL